MGRFEVKGYRGWLGGFQWDKRMAGTYLNGGRGAGQGDESTGRLVPDGGTGRVEQVVNTADEARSF